MATTAGVLSAAALQRIAAGAGFPPASQATAVAVALAESGGVVGIISPTQDYGLWQINKRAHGAKYDFARLLRDPAYNAAAAFEISSGGTNWGPWSAFKNGSYRRFMPQAEAAASAAGISNAVGQAATAAESGNAFGPFTGLIPGGGLIESILPGIGDAGDVANSLTGGWVDKLLEEGYRQLLSLVFAVAGLALAGLGLSRLTNAQAIAKKVATVGAAASTGGATLAASSALS